MARVLILAGGGGGVFALWQSALSSISIEQVSKIVSHEEGWKKWSNSTLAWLRWPALFHIPGKPIGSGA
jgi:hypothetical protein